MRIVTLGGGTGQGQLVRGLAAAGTDVIALVGVTDNGGHSGQLRRKHGIPAVGDLRSCLTALTPPQSLLGRALRKRFKTGKLAGASLGNLMLAEMTRGEDGSLTRAVASLESMLPALGRAIPVSDSSAQIAARLKNGKKVVGEWEIIRRTPRTPIARLFHEPPMDATINALLAIRNANLVVIGPGSLRTGLVSVLLARGVRDALRRKRVVYVLNILTQPGQTDGFSASDHVSEIKRYLGKRPLVLANTRRPPDWALQGSDFVDPEGIEARREDLLEPVKRSDLKRRSRPSQFIAGPHLVRHDPAKLARAILRIARRGSR